MRTFSEALRHCSRKKEVKSETKEEKSKTERRRRTRLTRNSYAKTFDKTAKDVTEERKRKREVEEEEEREEKRNKLSEREAKKTDDSPPSRDQMAVTSCKNLPFPRTF